MAATLELLAERGPTDLTVREIASKAGVQHPLIYRHFGDKASLIAVVVLAEMRGWAEAVSQADGSPADAVLSGFRHLAERPRTAAALRLAMDRTPGVGTDQAEFPIADAHAEVLVAAGLPPRRARDLAAVLMAVVIGWVGAEDFWLAAAHRTGSAQAARATVEAQLRTLVDVALAEVRGEEPAG